MDGVNDTENKVAIRINPLAECDSSNKTGAKQYPSIDQITKLHVFDFDNTIFRSPSPNPNLLHPHTVDMIKSGNIAGGWWGNPLTLRNVGLGWAQESKRKWEGFWNEDLIQLIEMSNSEKDTICVIMTGRRADRFAGLIAELLESRCINFDSLILKQDLNENTFTYKRRVIKDIIEYYTGIIDITVYDDRRAQLNGFQKFLNNYVKEVKPELVYHVVPVFLRNCFLDPKAERALVEEMVTEYNTKHIQDKIVLKQSIFYTGYVIPPVERSKLLQLLMFQFPAVFNEDTLADQKILLDFVVVSKHILTKVNEDELLTFPEMRWQITKIGSLDEYNYALKVVPFVYTECMGKSEFILPISTNLDTWESHTNKYLFIENYKKIDDWQDCPDLGERGVINTEFGKISNFKINEIKGSGNGVLSGGSGKKKRTKSGK